MKLASKLVTLVTVSMAIGPIACSAMQKIVAYKDGMDKTTESEIKIWQNNKVISSAKFKIGTDKRGTIFVQDPKKKYLYFRQNDPIRISFSGKAGEQVTYFPLRGESALNGGGIPIKSKIKISGTGYPYTIDIEPPKVRVKVKNNMETLSGKAKIYATNIATDSATKPTATQTYDSILVSNLSTRRLSVPLNKEFWIAIHDGTKKGIISSIEATPVTTSSVITIDAAGKATLAP